MLALITKKGVYKLFRSFIDLPTSPKDVGIEYKEGGLSTI